MATHSSILAWKIPWTEEPGGPQSMGSQSRPRLSTSAAQAQSLGWEEPLAEEMATHPSILAWKIPWTEEPGGL